MTCIIARIGVDRGRRGVQTGQGKHVIHAGAARYRHLLGVNRAQDLHVRSGAGVRVVIVPLDQHGAVALIVLPGAIETLFSARSVTAPAGALTFDEPLSTRSAVPAAALPAVKTMLPAAENTAARRPAHRRCRSP